MLDGSELVILFSPLDVRYLCSYIIAFLNEYVYRLPCLKLPACTIVVVVMKIDYDFLNQCPIKSVHSTSIRTFLAVNFVCTFK